MGIYPGCRLRLQTCGVVYHTDHTIPTSYFDERLLHREDLIERDDLYFNYLHKLSEDDYQSMGIGEELGLGKDDSLMSEVEHGSEQ